MRSVLTALRDAAWHQLKFRNYVTTNLEATNAFIHRIVDERHEKPINGESQPNTIGDELLSGVRIAVKDNIVTGKESNLSSTAASALLSQHVSPFEATVVTLLRQQGAIIDTKTNLDEFGMGSHSRSSHFGSVSSIHCRDGQALSAGGSSGGSAVAVASGEYSLALGTDTGGSVRLPAAYTGIFGFKPSYGLLSRWGVIQYANSLDTVGILATRIGDAEILFNLLNQFDGNDPTSLSKTTRSRIARTKSSVKGPLKIGVPRECNIREMSRTVRACYIETLKRLQDHGHTIVPVSLPRVQQALSAYYVLAPAEASSNLAKYDGIRYGTRSQVQESSSKTTLPLYANTRGQGFGEEVKRRILLGAYTLSSEAVDNHFIQAQKVRRLIQRDFDSIFLQQNPLHDDGERASNKDGCVDFLLTPTAPTEPPTLHEVQKQSLVQSYMNDIFTVPASLAGLPAISVPVDVNELLRLEDAPSEGMNVGMQLIGQFGSDQAVLSMAQNLTELQA